MREYWGRELGEIVGDHYFLEEAGGKDGQSPCREYSGTAGAAPLELRDHLGVMHQRTRDQMWEEAHK